jgi:hypothetical protein
MHCLINILLRFALLSVATAATLPFARDYPYPQQAAKAVYFLSNNDQHNAVHALPVGKDGTVNYGRGTPTGGKGGRAPASGVTDALNSQGSLQLVGNVCLPCIPLLLQLPANIIASYRSC